MNSKVTEMNACEREGEMLSYLYGELAADGRTRFETHLADCRSCIDEFAAVSHARFAVFEWQREEFAAIPTPKFAIPYQTERETAGIGFIESVRRLIAFGSGPAAVFAAAAIVVSLVMFGYVFRGKSVETAKNTEIQLPPIQKLSETLPSDEKPSVAVVDTLSKDQTRVSVAKASVSSRVSRASAAMRPVTMPTGRATAGNQRKIDLSDRTLDNDPDTDETLRLADLFADVDTLDL